MSNEKELEWIKFRYLSKLKNLISNFSWDLVATSSHDPEKATFNFSSHELTSSEKHLLSKGILFAIPPRQLDYSGYLTEHELLLKSTADLSVTSEDRERFKAKLKNIALSSYKLLNDNCICENNISSEELSSLKSLMRNKNIVIQKADEGNTVVILDKEKYVQGVKNAKSNSSKFIPLNIPPEDYINYIVNVEKKFRKLFNNLYDNSKISKHELVKICPVGSIPGIVDKQVVDNMPRFRPIFSAINTPWYNLAKFLIPILDTHNEFTV